MQHFSRLLYFLAFSANFVFSHNAKAAKNTTTHMNGTAKINFTKRIYNFGSIKRGETPQYSFHFINSGKEPLRILGVHVACGCTVVKFDRNKTYLPGEEGDINVVFDSSRFNGPVTKIVTVSTNQKLLPDRILTIKANIQAEFSANPPLVDFGSAQGPRQPQKKVFLQSINGFPLQILAVKFNKKALDVLYYQEEQSGQWVIDIALKTRGKSGFLRETVHVTTNSLALKTLEIPVRADIIGNIAISPSYLEFGAVNRKQTKHREINLNGKQVFTVQHGHFEVSLNGKRLANASDFLTVKLPSTKSSSSEPSQDQKVIIELTNSSNIAGSIHGKVALKTDDHGQKIINVDFYAFFR